MKCSEIIEVLESLAPRSMACEWDNPGLLAGRRDKEVKRIFLAVDATDEVLEETRRAGADLLITHHPLIFKPLSRVTDEDFIGRRILRMIQDDLAYFAMHTNFDAAPGCMGELAGKCLGLTEQQILEPMGETKEGVPYGIGTVGFLKRPMTLRETAEAVKQAFGLPSVTVFGDLKSEKHLLRAAICPGSGGGTMKEALQSGAQVYITGDIGHHEGIDAAAQGMAVIDAGHYGIEHIFTEFMERFLQKKLGDQVSVVRETIHFPNHVV